MGWTVAGGSSPTATPTVTATPTITPTPGPVPTKLPSGVRGYIPSAPKNKGL
jgi:hypothetical protein